MATSAAAGILTPIGDPILYDDELLDLIQPIIAAMAGYDRTLVRPGWQSPDLPNQPEPDVNWSSIRFIDTDTDAFAYEAHVDEGNGYDVVERTEWHSLLVSTYGPLAKAHAEQIRDAFALEQNRTPVNAIGLAFVSAGKAITLPGLLHGLWIKRVDITFTFRRYVSRKYGVLTITGLPTVEPAGINNEFYVTPLTLPPAP